MPKLLFHVICHGLEALLILKSQLLLQKVLFVSKLPPQLCSFLFEHLGEALLHEAPIVGKLFLPLQLELLELALRADHYWYIVSSLLGEPAGRGTGAGRSRLLRGLMSTTASNVTVAMDSIDLFRVESASGAMAGLFLAHLRTEG